MLVADDDMVHGRHDADCDDEVGWGGGVVWGDEGKVVLQLVKQDDEEEDVMNTMTRDTSQC